MFQFRSFMIVAGVLGLAFGLGLLLMPGLVLDTNGVVTDASGQMMARLCGAVLVEAGLLQILISGCREAATQKRALAAGLVGAVIGAVVTFWMQLSEIAGAMGWGNVAVYVLLLVGFWLTLRRGPAASSGVR